MEGWIGSFSSNQVLTALLIILVGIIMIRYVSDALESIFKRREAFQSTKTILLFLFRLFSWSVMIYLILVEVFSLSHAAYLILLCFILLITGFATRDMVRNILGGIMILYDRPYRVGDKIRIGNYYGTVMRVDLRATTLLTPDNIDVSVPHSTISNEIVANANKGQFNKKITTTFYLPVTLDIKVLKKVATRAVSVSKFAYLIKPVEVHFENEIHEGRSFLKMTVDAYVTDLRYEESFSSEITELVMDYLQQNNLAEMKKVSK